MAIDVKQVREKMGGGGPGKKPPRPPRPSPRGRQQQPPRPRRGGYAGPIGGGKQRRSSPRRGGYAGPIGGGTQRRRVYGPSPDSYRPPPRAFPRSPKAKPVLNPRAVQQRLGQLAPHVEFKTIIKERPQGPGPGEWSKMRLPPPPAPRPDRDGGWGGFLKQPKQDRLADKPDTPAPYPKVPMQPKKTEPFTMGDGIKRYLGGTWQEAQRKTQEAGQGNYREVGWGNLGDVTYNIGQWNPMDIPVGKGLTALAQSALMIGAPAVVAERYIGNGVYGQLKEEMQVGDTPEEQSAWQAALGVSYSGAEAVRNAYDDALKLEKEGQLDFANAEAVQARHGKWYLEALGQMVLDPLNVVSAGGKGLAQVARLRQAEKMLVQPNLIKGTKQLAKSADVLADMRGLASRGGQIKEAERLVDKALAVVNPRFKASITNRVAERTAQVLDNSRHVIDRRTIAELADAGIKRGDAAFDDQYMKLAGDNFQAYAVEMAKMASDDADEVAQAAHRLEQMGFGTVPQSTYGRRTAYVIRELIGNDKQKGFHKIMQEVKEAGGTAEEAATLMSKRVAEVFDNLIETPKWESSFVQRTAKGIIKAEKPVTDFYAKLFMGMSLGFPMRNATDNVASMVALHWSPFKPAGIDRAKQAGVVIQGAQRGIGQVGEEITGMGLTTFGLQIGQKIEQAGSTLLAHQFYDDAVRRLVRPAMKEVMRVVPEGADPHLTKSFEKAARMAIGGSPEDIAKLENELNGILRASGLDAAQAATPPSGPTSRILNDLWRQPSDDLIDQIQNTGDDLWPQVYNILNTADSPEAAVDAVRGLQRQIADHIGRVGTEAPNPGHVMGTPAGDAIHLLTSGSADVSAATLEDLAADLGRAQTSLQRSRAMAYKEIVSSTAPESWTKHIEAAEENYAAAMRTIKQGQIGEYAKLLAGEIDEAEYSKRVFSHYSQAKTTLDYDYRRAMTETLVPVEPIDDMATLRGMFTKLAQQAGHPSAHVRGWAPASVEEMTHTAYKMGREVPDRNFGTLLRDITGRDDVRHVTEMTDAELVEGINMFRDKRGLGRMTQEEIIGKAKDDWQKAQEFVIPEPLEAPSITAVPPESVGLTGAIVQPQDYEMWRKVYNINPDGMPVFEDITQVLKPTWKPQVEDYDISQWTAISFNRLPNGKIVAMRGRAHIPADKVFHAAMDPNTGKITNIQFAGALGPDTSLNKVQKYADDLVRAGVDPDTPLDATGVTGQLAKDIPQDVKKLGDLTTEDLGMMSYYRDATGQKVYAPNAGRTGKIPYLEYMRKIDAEFEYIAAKADDEVSTVVASHRQALAGEQMLDPSPTLMDAATTGGKQSLDLLDGLADEIDEFSKLPPPPKADAADAIAAAGDWEEAITKLKSVQFETHLMASEAGRRARDMALLDYSDRRYVDPLLKVIFPWGYWHSRKIPNWATSLALNPAAVAHYTNLKRELREYNNNDETVPEWAKGHIPLRPPGYPGSLYLNMDSSVNAVGAMFEDFDDPDQTRSFLGKVLQTVGMGGPAPHPLYMAAYAAERGIMGDTEGMRSYGYLAAPTRVFAAITGRTLEPWLWGVDPETGKRTPFKGGTKWDIEKSVRYLGYREKMGDVTHDEAVLGAATRTGKAYGESLQTILTQYRRVPVLASAIFGLRISPRQDWEVEVNDWSAQFGAAREAGDVDLQNQIMGDNPWLGAVWMSWDSEAARTRALSWDVLNRIPPGIKAEQKEEMLQAAGITPRMLDKFYDSDGEMSDWDPEDLSQFSRAMIKVAEVMGSPDMEEMKEWREARTNRDKLYDELEKKYPDIQETQNTYFQLKNAGNDAEARDLVNNTRLKDYWNDLNKAILDDPIMLKYFADPLKVDQAAANLMHETAEVKWPGVHQLQNEYYTIDPDDKTAQRKYRIDHPNLVAYWDWKKGAEQANRDMLAEHRNQAGSAINAPRTSDLLVGDKPTLAQQALLDAIDDLQAELDLPAPPPEALGEDIPEGDRIFYRQLDKAYANVWKKYPDAPEWEKTYDIIKENQGEETAKLYAKDVGLYEYWSAMSVERAENPVLLARMDNEQIEKAAKNITYNRAEEMWPGIFEMQAGYYAIPKRERRRYLEEHPDLKSYWDWKDGAKAQFNNELLKRRGDAQIGGAQ